MAKEKTVNSKEAPEVKSRFRSEANIDVVYTRKPDHELLGKIENHKGTESCRWFCESTRWCMHGTQRDIVACKGDISKCVSKGINISEVIKKLDEAVSP